MNTSAANLPLPEPEEYTKQASYEIPFAIDKPQARREIIKVIAVGGGGGNALNHIISKGLEGVDLLAVNTDVRTLDMSLCKDKIVLGEKTTGGLGAGAKPEVGERAARESIEEIREFLKGSDMVYFAAGMGGGTGTGALPVLAAAAKEMSILTVAVVTKPFAFEGTRRMRYAEAGIEKLRGLVDALIVVPNDRLLGISSKNTPLPEAFAIADEVLRMAVVGVTELVTRPGLVNVDFADLRTVMSQAGPAVMGVGSASGEDRIAKALEQALESPLMECSMQGARGVLMNISCGTDLGIFEVQSAAAYIESIMAEDATFVWGCSEDRDLEGKVEIVVVATGFDAMEDCAGSPPPAQNFRRNIPMTPPAPASEKDEPPQFTPYTAVAEIEVKEEENGKPFLISETPLPNSPAWLREKNAPALQFEGQETEDKTGTDLYDAPAFIRFNRKLNK